MPEALYNASPSVRRLAGTQSGLDAALGLAARATSGALQVEGARGRLLGRLDVDRGFGQLRVGVTATATGHRFDNAGNSLRLAGYGTVDLRVEYAINEAWSLQARAANVFDREYETVAWYNQPGREYQLTLRYRSR